MNTTRKRACLRLFLFGLVLTAFVSVTACNTPLDQQTDKGGSGVSKEDLKGVWKLVIAGTGQTSNIFLYFDGIKMYSAVKAGEQFAAVPQGTSVLEYKDGKLQYGAAGMMAEFVGKKNGENIDLYRKVNGQITPTAVYILKPSTESAASIKEAGSDEPCTGPCLRSILLTPGRLTYNADDLTITAVLRGKNFDLIASQPDKTIKVGIFDEEGVPQGSLVKADVIDTMNHSATVTLTAPDISADEATIAGKKYTVKVKLCGTYAKVTAPLTIAKEARLTENPVLEKTQIPSNEVTASTSVKMTVKGVNLALAVPASVQLYTAAGAEYGAPVIINTAGIGLGEVVSFEAAIPVPQEEGVYTAKVLFGSKEQTKYFYDPSQEYPSTLTNPTLQVYGRPKFTHFFIPNAGTVKEDHIVTARVTGVNFKAPEVSEASFTVSCAALASITAKTAVKVLSDTDLRVTLTIPGTAGNYSVKIVSGGESCTGTFMVKDYGDYSEYQAGRIVLKDGSIIAKDSYTEIAEDNPPIAVLTGGKTGSGAAAGIGLHTTADLHWAKGDSPGYYKKFTGIICTPNKTGSGTAETATFTGDTDGNDNWEYICEMDAEGTAHAEENYPAFHWVNEYAETYKTGEQKWYMPSIAELCEVYKNHATINESLAKIHGLNNDAADNGLDMSYYWSSSQHASNFYDAWQVNVYNGYLLSYKSNNTGVCCLSGF